MRALRWEQFEERGDEEDDSGKEDQLPKNRMLGMVRAGYVHTLTTMPAQRWRHGIGCYHATRRHASGDYYDGEILSAVSKPAVTQMPGFHGCNYDGQYTGRIRVTGVIMSPMPQPSKPFSWQPPPPQPLP